MLKVGGISQKLALLGMLASACSKDVDPAIAQKAAWYGNSQAQRILRVCSSGLDLANPSDRLNFLQCLDLPGHQPSEICDAGSGFSVCSERFKSAMKTDRFDRIYNAERSKALEEQLARRKSEK